MSLQDFKVGDIVIYMGMGYHRARGTKCEVLRVHAHGSIGIKFLEYIEPSRSVPIYHNCNECYLQPTGETAMVQYVPTQEGDRDDDI